MLFSSTPPAGVLPPRGFFYKIIFMKIIFKKFKDNKADKYKSWGQELSGGKIDEAKASLKEENLAEEATALVKINGEDYWIGVQVSDGEVLPANTERMVNLKHQETNKECLGESIDVDILYDIKAD